MSAPSPGLEAPLRANWHPDLLGGLLRRNRLTLLYSEQGPARDAWLRRALMPLLRPPYGSAVLPRHGSPRALRFDSWGALPLEALREQIDKALPPPPESIEPAATLAEQLVMAGGHHRAVLLLVLDDFEQHLAEPAQRADIERFDREFAACVTHDAVPLHVLLVLDEAQRRALRARYVDWIEPFERDWLRLPDLPADSHWMWSDTDIDAPEAEDANDDASIDAARDDVAERDVDWPLDLSLDAPAAPINPATRMQHPAAEAPVAAAASTLVAESSPVAAPPQSQSQSPAPAPTPAAASTPPLVAGAPSDATPTAPLRSAPSSTPVAAASTPAASEPISDDELSTSIRAAISKVIGAPAVAPPVATATPQPAQRDQTPLPDAFTQPVPSARAAQPIEPTWGEPSPAVSAYPTGAHPAQISLVEAQAAATSPWTPHAYAQPLMAPATAAHTVPLNPFARPPAHPPHPPTLQPWHAHAEAPQPFDYTPSIQPHGAHPHAAQPPMFAPPMRELPPRAHPADWSRHVPSRAFDPSQFQSPRGHEASAWTSEPDAQTLRRTQRAGRGGRGLLRLGFDLVVLVAVAWLVASWVIDNDPPALRDVLAKLGLQPHTTARPAAEAATGPMPEPEPNPAQTVPTQPPTARAPTLPAQAVPIPPGQTQPTAAPGALAAAPATAPAAAATAVSRTLAISVPPDGGAAMGMVEELVRQVAAPAGIALKVAAGSDAPSLAVWRSDTLQASRAGNGTPVRVLAPLYTEQIQVIVRNDAPWDYVHQIRSLRLNIGRADGARARTARALYRQMFDTPLPPALINEVDENQALQALSRRGGPIDGIVLVSESPVLPRLPPALRGQLRELSLDVRRLNTAMQSYPIVHRTSADKPHLGATSFLVTGAAPQANESTLRALTVALCRAQPALEARGSALLRGLPRGQQPAVGWPYLLPRAAGSDCPAEPPLADTTRRGSAAPAVEPAIRDIPRTS